MIGLLHLWLLPLETMLSSISRVGILLLLFLSLLLLLLSFGGSLLWCASCSCFCSSPSPISRQRYFSIIFTFLSNQVFVLVFRPSLFSFTRNFFFFFYRTMYGKPSKAESFCKVYRLSYHSVIVWRRLRSLDIYSLLLDDFRERKNIYEER